NMVFNRICDDLVKCIHPNNIGKEQIGNDKGYQQKNSVLQKLLPSLDIGIRTFIQFFLLGPVPFDLVFDPSEYELHKYGLRTGPTTPYTAIDSSKQDDTDQYDQHPKKEDMKVLWVKDVTKDGELPFNDVEHQERVSVYF